MTQSSFVATPSAAGNAATGDGDRVDGCAVALLCAAGPDSRRHARTRCSCRPTRAAASSTRVAAAGQEYNDDRSDLARQEKQSKLHTAYVWIHM